MKVLDSRGSGTWAQIICGINWVAAHASSDGIAVANMSLGGLGSSTDNGPCGATSALHQAICNATTAGVRFAVAAGNDAWAYPDSSLPDVPAAYDEVMTVTAYGDSNGLAGGGGAAPSCRSGEADDRYASFSNWSNNLTDNAHTIAAPGVCISRPGSARARATTRSRARAWPPRTWPARPRSASAPRAAGRGRAPVTRTPRRSCRSCARRTARSASAATRSGR